MLTHPLLGLHGIVFRTPERLLVGPIHLTIHRHEKILLRCATEPIYNAFVDVLSGKQEPIEGRLLEPSRVRMQTDLRVRQTLNPNRTIRELNAAARMPESIWLGQRRRSLFGVMDKLGIEPRHMHSPLKLEPTRIQEKYWALRFIASGADLLVGREVFALEDTAIREVIALCWGDLPGAVLYAGPPERIPTQPDSILGLNADGTVTIEHITERATDESLEAAPESPRES